jgi:ATPase subunit of ABC transporter with duplicated ATPase domains
MKIDKVTVRGCGPFRDSFTTNFVKDNCVIGNCGGGKTMLLRLIAGVAGSDAATEILQDVEVGFFRIRLSQRKKVFQFETEGFFDLDKVAEFKATLPHRVSFPLADWDGTAYPSEFCDPKLGRARFERFIAAHNDSKPFIIYSPTTRRASLEMGDGYTHALWLLLCQPPRGVPVLLDNPARHLDIWAKRMMLDYLTGGEHQVIFTTHDPEMVLHDGYTGANADQKVITVPKTGNTRK